MLGSRLFRRQVQQLLNDFDTGLFDTCDALTSDPFYNLPFFQPLLTDTDLVDTDMETNKEKEKEKDKDKDRDREKDKEKDEIKDKDKQLTAACPASSSTTTTTLIKSEVPFIVKLDVIQKDNEYQVVAELPGLSKEDVKLAVKDDMLTISGEKTNEQKIERTNYKRIERTFGKFSRSIKLPRDVDQSKISAAQEHGVLTITLPRIPSPASHQVIQIK